MKAAPSLQCTAATVRAVAKERGQSADGSVWARFESNMASPLAALMGMARDNCGSASSASKGESAPAAAAPPASVQAPVPQVA